jgi:hypothetical protein
VTRFYVYGDGRVWRMTNTQVRRWENSDRGVAGRMMSSQQNMSTGNWTNLPTGIYQYEGDLYSGNSDEVRITHYDYLDDEVPEWKRMLEEEK